MVDVRVAELAARQHNRFARSQLSALGLSDEAIRHRLDEGRWIAVHEAVFAIAPVLDDERGRLWGAALTEHGSVLSHASAGAAHGWWSLPRDVEVVTRPGSGGPRTLDGVLVFRSETLVGQTTVVKGLPVTTVPRTLLDLTPTVGDRALARCVREALRLRSTTVAELVDALTGPLRGRRGSRRLLHSVSRYSGLPVHRARSGAEVRALELLSEGGRPMPYLNRRIAGEEADLSWPKLKLIIEIDGAHWHQDAGEDARKTAVWERAGWTVRRVSTAGVYDRPHDLLAAAPNVREPRP